MKRFLLLVAVVVVSCSKSYLLSDAAPMGTWQTECLALDKGNQNAPLSFKGVLSTNGSLRAVLTKFSDGACSKPYATVHFRIDSPIREQTNSKNAFILRSFLREVSFVAHTPEALTDLSASIRDIEASALVMEKAIDVTDKHANYKVGALKMDFSFQFKKSDTEEDDEDLARISVVRPIDERFSHSILNFKQARKVSRD